MWLTISAILIIIWILGMVMSYTAGGIIHLLPVLALVGILLKLVKGKDAEQSKNKRN